MNGIMYLEGKISYYFIHKQEKYVNIIAIIECQLKFNTELILNKIKTKCII